MDIKNRINWGKWLIFLIGLIFTIYSIFLGSLALFGTEINANITSYRQQLSERDETIRNQYTYVFGYEFSVEGKTYSGTGQKISNSIFLKNESKMKMRVKYLQCCPQFNSAYDEKNTFLNIIISFLIGMGLILITKRMDNS